MLVRATLGEGWPVWCNAVRGKLAALTFAGSLCGTLPHLPPPLYPMKEALQHYWNVVPAKRRNLIVLFLVGLALYVFTSGPSALARAPGVAIREITTYATQGTAPGGSELASECDSLAHVSTVEASEPVKLEVQLKQVEMAVLDSQFSKYVVYPNVKQSQEQRLAQHWLVLSGSAVWIEAFHTYYYVSQVSFSASGNKTEPTVSFLWVQFYDRTWQDLSHTDLLKPVSGLLHLNYNYQGTQTTGLGPQNPQVVNRRADNGADEPMIVFDMLAEDGTQGMFLFSVLNLWLRRLTTSDPGRATGWVPFHEGLHVGHLGFITSFEPMTTVQCDIATGKCAGSAVAETGALHEATPFVFLPQALRMKAKRPLWLGFALVRQPSRGCGSISVRPRWVLMDQDPNGSLRPLGVSGPVDLGLLPWEGSRDCSLPNMLVVTAMPMWRLSNGQDALEVVVHNGNQNYIVTLRGLAKHLMGIPGVLEGGEALSTLQAAFRCAVDFIHPS